MVEFSFQPKLMANLPSVKNNKFYDNYYNLFQQIDKVLVKSGIERQFISFFINRKEEAKIKTYAKKLTLAEINRTSTKASTILRCSIARVITQESYGKFSIHLAESALLQQFCRIYDLVEIKVPSTSRLQREEKLIPAEILESLNQTLFSVASNQELNLLELEETFADLEVFGDATCILSNIHFPVDWSLLRDGSITLLKSIKRIRKAGLKSRVNDPQKLLSQVNQLAIGLGRCKGFGAVKKRKKAYRKLRKFANRILDHAKRYYNLLESSWQGSSLTVGVKDEILNRMEKIMKQLPKAIKLASKRIINGEVAKNSDKILSLYDDSTNVIIRGKAGAQVEFGCKLMLSELSNGFIVDWKLYEKDTDDVTLTVDAINRMKGNGIKVKAIVTDKGCDGARSRQALKENKVENKMCSRNPKKFKEQMKDENFKRSQKRRAQTEARIAIIKNNFIGNAIKTKNFESKKVHIAWTTLAHNIKLVANLRLNNKKLQMVA